MYAAVDTSDYDSPEVWIFPDKESVEQFARDYDGDVWVVSVSNGYYYVPLMMTESPDARRERLKYQEQVL